MFSVLWDKAHHMHLQRLMGTRPKLKRLCKILEVLFNPQKQEYCPKSWKNNRPVYCQTAQNGWLMQLSGPLSPSRIICPNWKGMLEKHGKTQLSQSHASFKIRAVRKPGCMRLYILQDKNLQMFWFIFLLSGHPEQRPSCQRGALQQADLPPCVVWYVEEVKPGMSSYWVSPE